jgi:membrane protease YdiL (CAAX protease family)
MPEDPPALPPPGPWKLALGGIGDCVIFLLFLVLFLVPAIIANPKAWTSGISRDSDVLLVITLVLSPAALMLTIVMRWLRWRRTDSSWPVWIENNSARHAAMGALVGVAALAGGLAFYTLAEKFLNYHPDKEEWAKQLMARVPDMTLFLKALLITGLAVMAPLAEETYFRGMLLRSFVKSGHTVFGVIVSSALFALLHFETIGFVEKFSLGLLFAWLYLRTGSLTASMVAHATNNGIIGVAMLLQKHVAPHAAKLPHHS